LPGALRLWSGVGGLLQGPWGNIRTWGGDKPRRAYKHVLCVEQVRSVMCDALAEDGGRPFEGRMPEMLSVERNLRLQQVTSTGVFVRFIETLAKWQ
jgi:hypothetical protein